jgi:hypothetical protein
VKPSRNDESPLIHPRTLTLVAIVAAAAATRIIPLVTEWWNFTALGAVCLFGGAYFTRRWMALAVPLAAMLVSDIVLAAFKYGWASLLEMWMTYVLFALTAGIGMLLRGRLKFDSLPGAALSLTAITGAAIASSVMFFVLSNGQYWLTSGRYPLTAAGLLECYTMALPFAEKMFASNLVYSAILFGGFELLSLQWPELSLRRNRELVPVRA